LLDIVTPEHSDGAPLLVMEYLPGETLSAAQQAARAMGEKVPTSIALSVVSGLLLGLHAAHEATDESGAPLHLIHRDVSPQNLMIGVDGLARVLDFGIAKARGRLQTTSDGRIKGKYGYLSPEQVNGKHKTTRATD